jgi:hypothetical protein
VPTHIAPKYNRSIDDYTPYNKPLAIHHWLSHAQVPPAPGPGLNQQALSRV